MNEYTSSDLHDQYHRQVQRYLTRFVVDDLAQELTQETFIKVQQGLTDFRGQSTIKTWIYRIATNVLKDHLKSRRYRNEQCNIPLTELQPDYLPETDLDAEQTAIRDEMNQCITEFIQRLPKRYTTVLVLSELEGYAIKEIAQILDDTPAAIKVRLHRAKARLKKALDGGCTLSYNERSEFSCERRPSYSQLLETSDQVLGS